MSNIDYVIRETIPSYANNELCACSPSIKGKTGSKHKTKPFAIKQVLRFLVQQKSLHLYRIWWNTFLISRRPFIHSLSCKIAEQRNCNIIALGQLIHEELKIFKLQTARGTKCWELWLQCTGLIINYGLARPLHIDICSMHGILPRVKCNNFHFWRNNDNEEEMHCSCSMMFRAREVKEAVK